MLIWWGNKVREKKLSSGSFDCPHCRSHQPCEHRALGKYFTFYSIPLGETERIEEFVICAGCGRKFDSASYQSARGGTMPVAVTWDCPKCHISNPNYSYKCVKCGYSLV